jgi:protein gp37
MAAITSIQWTDRSWNPVRGCSRKSAGCINCYAEPIARRFSGPGLPYEGLVHPNGTWNGRIREVESALNEPLTWRKPARVFVNSMSDLFHENLSFDFIDKVFAMMTVAPQHTFQILTKRPERMLEYMKRDKLCGGSLVENPWPLPNVHLGVSVENQPTADERIPLLHQTPAAVRFVSFEPVIAPIDVQYPESIWPKGPPMCCSGMDCGCMGKPIEPPLIYGIGWAILGGESGPGARPCALGWLKDLVNDCKTWKVPVFVKQLGAKPTNREGEPCPHIHARKGDDMSEWPNELKVREWPRS